MPGITGKLLVFASMLSIACGAEGMFRGRPHRKQTASTIKIELPGETLFFRVDKKGNSTFLGPGSQPPLLPLKNPQNPGEETHENLQSDAADNMSEVPGINTGPAMSIQNMLNPDETFTLTAPLFPMDGADNMPEFPGINAGPAMSIRDMLNSGEGIPGNPPFTAGAPVFPVGNASGPADNMPEVPGINTGSAMSIQNMLNPGETFTLIAPLFPVDGADNMPEFPGINAGPAMSIRDMLNSGEGIHGNPPFTAGASVFPVGNASGPADNMSEVSAESAPDSGNGSGIPPLDLSHVSMEKIMSMPPRPSNGECPPKILGEVLSAEEYAVWLNVFGRKSADEVLKEFPTPPSEFPIFDRVNGKNIDI